MGTATLLLAGGSVRAHAQRRSAASIGVQAVPVLTRVKPGVGGRTLTEGYLSQPVLMADASLGGTGLATRLTLNLEGLTLERGELSPGTYGEGYVDRRHPHTYLHEALAIVQGGTGTVRASIVGGKGFAPFGTDDPMMRPFEKYPVNHHQAQILERYVAAGALRLGPLIGEVGWFNGDEPTGAGTVPNASRFGDSWSSRVTFVTGAAELSGSYASVASPEFRAGEGLDQRKWSAAWRWAREAPTGVTYAFIEWARSDEMAGPRRAFRFSSLLAELTTRSNGTSYSLRLERTMRPEEERLANPFRTARPVSDFSLNGITRWDAASMHVETPPPRVAGSNTTVVPFFEVSVARPVESIKPSAFDPAAFYGKPRIWSYSAGVRIVVGSMRHRMGRYGVADVVDKPSMHSGRHDD